MCSYNKKKIVILMATYNGERFLIEQIESIINQSVKDWILLIRDDGSTDTTLSLINNFAKTDQRVQLLVDDIGLTGSAYNNFGLLCDFSLKHAYDYYFFSDQDDIWHKDKLKLMLAQMVVCECGVNNSIIPSLIYSDLSTVDENGIVIADSFMHYQKLKDQNSFVQDDNIYNTHAHNNPILKNLLVQNYVTGCAMMVNYHLLNLACPFPQQIIMHDWWLALCASSMGKIQFIEQPLTCYRQHSFNQVGAKGHLANINPFNQHSANNGENALRATIIQAGELYRHLAKINFYNNTIHNDTKSIKELIKNYSELLSQSVVKRIINVVKLGFKRQGIFPYFTFLIRLVLMSKTDSLAQSDNR